MRLLKLGILAISLTAPAAVQAASATLLGWNNLGMHCMDSDYSVFSILPPYNTVEAQLIVGGSLIRDGSGYTVTYEAVADPAGSINSTALGKGNFYTYAAALYGASLAPDAGLAGWAMPGVSNTPQPMLFEATNSPAAGVLTLARWFRAEGIPISPYDDAHRKNPYPLMRLVARNASGVAIATNDVVLPVSDEMDCRVCHASGAHPDAQPAAGWAWNGLPERDFRLNILRLHDERQFLSYPDLYARALAARGFDARGLYRGVVASGKPVLCAACHASEALGTASFETIPPLTAAVHSFHAYVQDPILNVALDDSTHRAACYRCHPGSTTRCLRGAMGGAVAEDGTQEMQCQSCHGNMSAVGDRARVGWFMEPNCQSCHTGTATHNNGAIRYASAFEAGGAPRVPVDTTFATTPNTPADGLSLYRFSTGHGGLQCSACHGSTHAEFPSTHANDNLRNEALQGHAGVMVECTACHASISVNSATAAGGPHGMHPVGQAWVSGHGHYAERGLARCQACHGADNRGTVLSRVQGPRALTARLEGATVTLNLYRGATIGCYTCHNGPNSESANPSATPTVAAVSGTTPNHEPLRLPISVTPASAVLRVISQPAHGALGVSNRVLTYFPNPGFTGSDSFTYAAWDGAKNSALAVGSVSVTQGPVGVGVSARVPPAYPAAWPVAFAATAKTTNTLQAAAFEWDFGDGSPGETNAFAAHAYAVPGAYSWTLVATAEGASAKATGVVAIGEPVVLTIANQGDSVGLSWPSTLADVLLEESGALDGSARWVALTNTPIANSPGWSVTLPKTGSSFYRLNRPW